MTHASDPAAALRDARADVMRSRFSKSAVAGDSGMVDVFALALDAYAALVAAVAREEALDAADVLEDVRERQLDEAKAEVARLIAGRTEGDG